MCIRDRFPHVPVGALDRPYGQVGILIGQDVASLLPRGGDGIDSADDLTVMKVPFGSGYVLGGTHPEIQAKQVAVSYVAALWKNAVFCDRPTLSINHVRTAPASKCFVPEKFDFFEAEAVGINVPRRCVKCQGCQNCVFTDDSRSVEEQLELSLLKKAICFNEDKGHIEVEYPVIGPVEKLVDNRAQAIKRASSLIKSLEKKGLKDEYDAQVQDYIQRGVWKETSEDSIKLEGVLSTMCHTTVS